MRVWVALVVTTLLLLPRLAERWPDNQWALRFVWCDFESPQVPCELPAAPPSIAWASVWLARSALQIGDPAAGMVLARPLAVQGDAFGLEVTGSALMAQGDLLGALRAWEKAGAYWRLRTLAERAVMEERLDLAAAAYEAGYALYPQEGILIRAKFLWQQAQDSMAAESLLRRALREYPFASKRDSWQRLLAEILLAQRRWDDVESVYSQLLKENPDDLGAYIDLGWLYYQRGDGEDAALAQFERTTTIAPERGEGYFAIGLVLMLEGRGVEADFWFARAEARNPEARWWYMVRGDRVRQTSDLALAMEIYEAAIKRFPGYADAYYELAWTYRLNRQSAEAINAIEQALALAEPHVDHLFYLRAGKIYEWVGERAKGLAAYRAVLATNPKNEEAAQGAARLAGRP